jgi:hypothetical protein
MGNFPYLIKNPLIAWPGIADRQLPSQFAGIKTIRSSFYPRGPRMSFKCFSVFFSSWGSKGLNWLLMVPAEILILLFIR